MIQTMFVQCQIIQSTQNYGSQEIIPDFNLTFKSPGRTSNVINQWHIEDTYTSKDSGSLVCQHNISSIVAFANADEYVRQQFYAYGLFSVSACSGFIGFLEISDIYSTPGLIFPVIKTHSIACEQYKGYSGERHRIWLKFHRPFPPARVYYLVSHFISSIYRCIVFLSRSNRTTFR